MPSRLFLSRQVRIELWNSVQPAHPQTTLLLYQMFLDSFVYAFKIFECFEEKPIFPTWHPKLTFRDSLSCQEPKLVGMVIIVAK